jgi:hypothetical protein
MNSTADTHAVTTQAGQSPRSRLIAARILYAGLAVQFAAWITLVAASHNLLAAFTRAQPGSPDGLIAGGAIWLVQFAAVVILFRWRLAKASR